MASDYTDALAEKAIALVFANLEQAYNYGDDKDAREKMHNASCIAGMAFTNAFLGINHSMAHKVGGEFHIPHGRTNAILLPYTVAYNAERPSKFASFPKYDVFKADIKYAEIADSLGLKASTVEEGVNSLVEAIKKLNKAIDIPTSFKDAGVDENEFMSKLDIIAENAFEDQCTTANPRMPLVSELKEILRKAYYGE
jgi:acetaldehyde dehydrogenase/alcohol dehydrogenase